MKQYDVFISYRRDGGFEMAQMIHDRLQKKGLRVFLDVESLRSGKFNEQLYNVIQSCRVFVLIESPHALDRCVNADDWVRMEIEHAFQNEKVVIPVMLKGFSYPENLPESLRDLPLCNGIEPSKNYFDASIDKLYELVVHAGGQKPAMLWLHRNKTALITGVACLLLVGALVVFLPGTRGAKTDGWEQAEVLSASQSDSHVLLKLENGSHQYEMGLENWRRLDYNRAQRDITEAQSAIGEEVGADQVEMAKISHTLGCLYLDMGRYQEAYDDLNSAYITFRDTFGPEDGTTLAVEFALAQYDYYTGDVDTALKTLQRISDSVDPVGNEIPLTLIRHFQAQIYEELGQYQQAEEIYRSVLSLYDRYLEDGKLTKELTAYTSDPELSRTQKDEYTMAVQWISLTAGKLGSTCQKLGKTEEAQEILTGALNMCLDNVYIGQKNLVTSELYKNLACLDLETGQLQQGIESIDLAMRIQMNVFDFEAVYPGLCEVYGIYGDLLLEKESPEKAKAYYDDALTLAQASYGENHPVTAQALGSLGEYALRQGSYQDAQTCFLRAIEIRKNILSYQHVSTLSYLTGLSEAYRLDGQTEAMAEAQAEAELIRERLGIVSEI